MRFLLCHTLLLSSLLLLGCGDDDGGPDAGGGTECGAVTCPSGTICCNASCGTCVSPGESCSAALCEMDGGGSDAGGRDAGHEAGDAGRDAGHEVGDAGRDAGGGPDCGGMTCASGEQCCPGCEGAMICAPAGAACPLLDCPGEGCGGIGGGAACEDTEYCDYPADSCGADDGGGTCLPRPSGCPRDCPGVCGCDGATYCNRCLAAASGVDTARDGACGDPADCAPMDAAGEGPCEAFFGYAWNGSSCVGLSGCRCVGRDCGATFDSPDACMAAYASCGGGSGRACGARLGATCDADEFCDFPPGAICDFADATGVCVARPGRCTDVDAPVCGCDGRDYGNECLANAAGTDVASAGPCRVRP